MTVTDRTAATDEEFRSRIAAFEAAPTPPEIVDARVVEEVARAMADVDDVDWDSELTLRIGTRDWYLRYAAAAVAAYRAQDGGAEEAVRRVSALAAEWAQDQEADYRAGVGGAINKLVASRRLSAALAPRAGDGAR